jgi:hypothetical protein
MYFLHQVLLFLLRSLGLVFINFVEAAVLLIGDQGAAIQIQYERFAADPRGYGGRRECNATLCAYHKFVLNPKRACARALAANPTAYHDVLQWLFQLRLVPRQASFDYGIDCVIDYVGKTWRDAARESLLRFITLAVQQRTNGPAATWTELAACASSSPWPRPTIRLSRRARA